MWPFRKLRKAYLINKPVAEVYEVLKKITDYDFEDRSSIKGRLLNIEPLEFRFYTPVHPERIPPFRTDLLVTVLEENVNTSITTVAKSNLIFPVFLFMLVPHFISYMCINSHGWDIKDWLMYIIWFLIPYFGDLISKKVVVTNFEHYIKKARLV